MIKKTKLNRIAIAVAMSIGMSGAAMAQETSASITGNITGPQGNPAAGTKVTITHVPSGSTKTTVVNDAGQFAAVGLRVGGPYRIAFDSDKFEDKTVEDVFLQLGEEPSLNLALGTGDIERISVTASALSAVEFGSTSPGSTFNITDLQQAASADRDIKDLIRIDPRISIAEANGDEAIICGGNNPRFSSLTVDGVRMNDSFGLNFNGYPTTRQPFSFDAIDQVAVEIAPFDVQYGGFTGCNINAVTKSGTNEIRGGLFYDYSSDSLTGDTIDGVDVDLGSFDKKRYGFNVGLPIISDKLFLFAAYEKLEDAQVFTYDALNNGSVTLDEINRAIQISKDVYGYDPGGMPTSTPVEDEKVLVKLDWNIVEGHRAALVYTYNDGFLIDQSDESSSTLTLSNHFYKKGAKLNAVVASLYSDWSDNFSTELRIGQTHLDNLQRSVDADSGFGEVQIESLPNGGRIFIGPDDSRQTNNLNWESQTFKFSGTYYLEDHTITGGFEGESLDIFNIFMQHTIGEYRFGGDSRHNINGITGLDDYESGRADDIFYNNSAVTNNPNDAAASFSYTTYAAYLQDEWSLEDLTLKFGLRYDWVSSDDKPNFNQTFQDRYGYTNQTTFDGEGLLQPRFGFNYSLAESMEVRGGIGLYQGGNPNVWLANSYSNDGITNFDTIRTNFQLLDDTGAPLPGLVSGDGRAIFNPLNQLIQEVADNNPSLGNEPSINVIDPDFKLPKEWKYSLGFTYSTEDDYVFQFDYLYTKKVDSAAITDLSLEQTGSAVDGRPIYDKAVVGTNDDGSVIRRNFLRNDFVLTNATENGDSTTISVAMNKEYDFGLDVNVGYAFNESTEFSPMNSAVSFSNYSNIATSDPLNPGISTSDYEVPHNFTFNLHYGIELFEGYNTNFTLFGSRKQGRPVSYTFNNLRLRQDVNAFRQLLYVPSMEEYGTAVKFSSPEVQADFDAFVADFGLEQYRGSIVPRNAGTSSWTTRVDFRIDQEIPGFYKDHKANAFLVVKNLGNFLNDEWGITRQGPFSSAAVVAARVESDGTYTYTGVLPNSATESVFQTQSLWEIKVGVKYQF